MPVLVQKYGGSSVADVEKIRRVAEKVRAKRDEGYQMVVVVSAMGDTTDDLLSLAKQVSGDPPRRELDMLLTCGERISMALLSMALHELGCPAISFTGSQSGIITNDSHAAARIVEVRPFRILDELALGKIVIVAGYQGVSFKREVTTLGRGGSDTTAVALAAALGAEACEIYSDVDGVFSADPRWVPDARKLSTLSYDEMQELAAAGAKVLNAQAVEFAKQKGITILAKSSFGGGTGTSVSHPPPDAIPRVAGVTGEVESAVVSVEARAAEPSISMSEVLEFLEVRGGKPRLVSFSSGDGGGTGWAVLPLQDVHGLEVVKDQLRTRFDGRVTLNENVGTVTCVGSGINADGTHLRRALAAAERLEMQILAVHTSPLQISLLVPKEAVKELTRRLHAELIAGS